jgi:hypothetical protein
LASSMSPVTNVPVIRSNVTKSPTCRVTGSWSTSREREPVFVLRSATSPPGAPFSSVSTMAPIFRPSRQNSVAARSSSDDFPSPTPPASSTHPAPSSTVTGWSAPPWSPRPPDAQLSPVEYRPRAPRLVLSSTRPFAHASPLEQPCAASSVLPARAPDEWR